MQHQALMCSHRSATTYQKTKSTFSHLSDTCGLTSVSSCTEHALSLSASPCISVQLESTSNSLASSLHGSFGSPQPFDEVLSLGSSYHPSEGSDQEPDGDPTLNDVPRHPPFKLLSDLPKNERRELMASLRRQVKDVDSWNTAMSPRYVLRKFTIVNSNVHLRGHYSGKVRGNEIFAEWLCLGDVGFRARLVELNYKTPFFTAVRNEEEKRINRRSVTSLTYGAPFAESPKHSFQCKRELNGGNLFEEAGNIAPRVVRIECVMRAV
ncbi:hypothetical protein CNN02455 [Cryptococcus deneoformans JEC21]|uniref:Uncharacterized protein n=1 Tax=Cryptococcus deneoformans (strain JEC21 / ATCC MYA-565) TaxID=214684 RepID=A0A0S2M689_CRYD1|nr:hypothetical protein CNN02455 [Cryptococcus neoformans var. neoformans JEC21]ALO69829.1 hypothetical protein CNN02455 [Cryptococcus neoformans var. neoformans JEC21]